MSHPTKTHGRHIRGEALAFAYPGCETLFANASFEITLDESTPSRIGLIGPNGHGKSTLLKLLQGSLQPIEGRFVPAPSAHRIAVLPQRFVEDSLHVELETFVLGDEIEVRRMREELNTLEAKMATEEALTELLERYGTLLEQFEQRDGWQLDARFERIMSGLGLTHLERSAPLSRLSSGERTRASLARLLLAQAELLLLDEPTNHLDIQTLRWLEGFLSTQAKAMVVISHDRAFLDAVVNTTWHLERGRFESYPDTPSAYLEFKEQRRLSEEHAYAQQQREIKRLERALRERTQWAKNRESDKYGDGSVDTGFIGHQAAKMMKRAKNLERRLTAELEEKRVETPWLERPVRFQVKLSEPAPRHTLSARGLTMAYGERTLFKNLDLDIEGGQRLTILGPNGCGKSTLLAVLAQALEPNAGALRLGPRVHMHHMSQEHAELLNALGDKPALYAVTDNPRDAQARTVLGCLGITQTLATQPLQSLSPGELSRVALARAVRSGANLLLLDEPTNHLDLAARMALEEALAEYQGTIICVTHDRRFAEALGGRQLHL